MSPRLIVTRPAAEAARWVQQLAARGVAAAALPLIDIVAEPPNGALAAARARLGEWQAAMFVSGNAVTAFFQPNVAMTGALVALPAIETRAWSPGPGTTAALLGAGWPAERIDAPAADAPQFDSESLWARVAPQARPGVRVLLVRGAGADGVPAGRDWLATRLRAAGVQVDQVAAYRRMAPRFGAAERALAQAAAQDGSVWLFSSSEAVANLVRCLPAQPWQGARALATHPRIAAAARSAGFAQVHESRPTLEAIVAATRQIVA